MHYEKYFVLMYLSSHTWGVRPAMVHFHFYYITLLICILQCFIILLRRLQLGDVKWMIEVRLTKATLFRKEFGKQHKVRTTTYLQLISLLIIVIMCVISRFVWLLRFYQKCITC